MSEYRFKIDRAEIENRRDNLRFEPDSGMAPEELIRGCERIAASGKPRALIKAELLCYIFENARLELVGIKMNVQFFGQFVGGLSERDDFFDDHPRFFRFIAFADRHGRKYRQAWFERHALLREIIQRALVKHTFDRRIQILQQHDAKRLAALLAEFARKTADHPRDPDLGVVRELLNAPDRTA